MISVRIASDIGRVSDELKRRQGQIGRAIAQGLNDGGDKTRTQVRAAMQAETGLLRLNSVTRRQRTIRAYTVGREALSGIGPARPMRLSYAIGSSRGASGPPRPCPRKAPSGFRSRNKREGVTVSGPASKPTT